MTEKQNETVKGETLDIGGMFGTVDAAEQPVRMEVALAKTGAGSGVFITLVGRDSLVYRELARKLQNRRFEQLRKTRTLTMTAEQNEEETLRLLSSCVRGWESTVYTSESIAKFKTTRLHADLVPTGDLVDTFNLKGELLPCNAANVRRVFETSPELREQVEDFLQDRTNFLTGSQQA